MPDRTAKELIETLIGDVEKSWTLLQEARHETEFARNHDIRAEISEELHDKLPADIVAFLHRLVPLAKNSTGKASGTRRAFMSRQP